MAQNMILFSLIMIIIVSLSKPHVEAQVDCGDVIFKLINCESFLFRYANGPSPQCCAGAQDLVQAANASRDVLKATCHCLKKAVQTLPVNLTNAAQLLPLCQLNLTIPISPSVNCDLL